MANTYREDLEAQDTQASRFILNIDLVNKNPSAIQRLVIQEAEDMLAGEVTIVDPTNPFVYLSSVTAATTAAFVVDNESSERRSYAVVAQTPEDLYYHMSDKDYLERFASPAKQTFWVMVSMPELMARAVRDPVTGNKRVTIPRYSTTVVSDYSFLLPYSVDIIQYSHGSWGVLYRTEGQHPLLSLATNEIPYAVSKATANEQAALVFKVDMIQSNIISREYDVNASTGFKKRLNFVDSFCYARVFHKGARTNNAWVEMKTTHSDFTYDKNTPTAILKVLPGALDVVLPQTYMNSGRVSGSVRVDVYSTRGEISINTQNIDVSAFVSDWNTIDKADQTNEVAAWQAINNKTVYARAMITGGKNADSFETLRNKVQMNTVGPRRIPITDAQIKTALQNEGFDIVKHVDVLTERQFHATRAMPRSFDEKLITPGNASIETIIATTASFIGVPGVLDNGERVTLSPNVVYKSANGVIHPVRQSERDELASMRPDALAQAVTTGNYLFTPFHYVLDPQDNGFEARPYYMDDPEISRRIYIDQNNRTGMQVGTQSISLERVGNGYSLLLVSSGNDVWRGLDDSQAHVQLSFIPTNETARAYLNGELVARTNDNNFIFQFNLESSFDITAADELIFKSFKIVNLEDRLVSTKLGQSFDLIYSSSAAMPPSWTSHAIDMELGNFLLPNRIAAVTQERITIDFGTRLNNLWAASRSFTEAAPYKRYEVDVFDTYEEDVYETDQDTGLTFRLGADGRPVFMPILHSRGEVVMHNGEPLVRHRKGDPVLDSSGNHIPLGTGYVTRQFDVFFIEGAYFFATDYSTKTYREQMVKTVVRWINIGLAEISREKLEQTSIFFYPKTNMGTIRGVVGEGQVISLQAAQSFAVKLYVTKEVNDNVKLKDSLTTTAIKFIDTELKKSTVSISVIVDGLTKAYGGDVISINVSGLGGASNFDAFTALDDRQRCSIRKKLFAQPDGELIVREDVSVEFIQMTAS